MRELNLLIVACLISTVFAEVAEARIFRNGLFGRLRCTSCQPRRVRRARAINANNSTGNTCSQLNQVNQSTHLLECVDSRGKRTLVQKIQDLSVDNLSATDLVNDPNVEIFRDPLNGEPTVFRRLFIDRNGIVRDRTGLEIERFRNGGNVLQGLRATYRPGFTKFRNGSREQNAVTRFLAANSGVVSPNGSYDINLDAFTIPGELAKTNPSQDEKRRIALRTLNFLLNTINTNCDVRFEDSEIQNNGTVRLNFFERTGASGQTSLESCLGPGNQLLIESADPTFACTGKVRLDSLVSHLMNPKTYYELMNAPQTRQEFTAIVGIGDGLNTREPNGRPNTIYITEGEPTTDPRRIIKFQEKRGGAAPGQYCFRSFDFDSKNEGDNLAATNVLTEGINVNHNAEEWLCLGRNGFMQGYIFDRAGKRLDAAPHSIASGGIAYKGEVAPVVSCLDCHQGGFRAGQIRTNGQAYTDHSSKLDPRFFTTNAAYASVARASSNTFVNTLKRHNAYYPDPERKPYGNPTGISEPLPYRLLPAAIQTYESDIAVEDINRLSSGLISNAPQEFIKDGKISRGNFETAVRSACNQNQVLRTGNGFDSQFFRANGGVRFNQIQHNNNIPNIGGGCANGRCSAR